MGGQSDFATITGENLTEQAIREHFDQTVETRQYDHGRYSGTMAESNGNFEIVEQVFENEEDAKKYISENNGPKNPRSFIESFSSKNHTNCARFKGEDGKGAIYGGTYSY